VFHWLDFCCENINTKPYNMKGITLLLFFILILLSCEKENYPGEQIYYNSFESQSDTTGWTGYAFNFANDVPKHGGTKSLSISGGCVIPHAEYTLPPQNTDSYLTVKIWGKNLSNGGSIYLYVNKAGYKEINFNVSEKYWKLYESRDTLFCPANTSMTLGAIAGGISSSAILIDMVEIRKLNITR
jgi:hypothetical protein